MRTRYDRARVMRILATGWPVTVVAAMVLSLASVARAQGVDPNCSIDNVDIGAFFGKLRVGIDGPGSCTYAGKAVSYPGLSLGVNPPNMVTGTLGGSGTVTATQSSLLMLTGLPGLTVGQQWIGVMTISNGTVVEGLLSASCCNFVVANGAGSTGALTVTDPGTRLDTLSGPLGIGAAGVFTLANDGFEFGIPGGATTASLDILNGAEVHSQNGLVANGPFQGSPRGDETIDATVTVNGAGSRWTLDGALSIATSALKATGDTTGSTTGNVIVSSGGFLTASFLSAGSHATCVGTLRVSEGASVEVGGLRLGENAGSRGIVDVSNARLINHPTTVGQWVIGHLGSARFDVVKGGEVINDQSGGDRGPGAGQHGQDHPERQRFPVLRRRGPGTGLGSEFQFSRWNLSGGAG
jgi:T5SS/PEP-CTERM-associated repeat protein